MAGGKHILGKPKSHRIFGTARVGERGQIVIPKEARQFYDIRPGAGAGQRRKRPGAVQARGAGPGGQADFRRYGKE